jgi:L-fuculose-phosphate aldolase
MDLDDPRFLVSAARRMLYREGCDSGVGGHVSLRAKEEGAFWVSTFGYFDETMPADVEKVDFDLNVLESGTANTASPAIQFHRAIYRERPDVNSVIHTHSRWAAIFATTGRPIGVYHDPACLIHGEQTVFVDDPAFPPVEGKRVAAALGRKRVLLLKNHGVIVAGATIAEAAVLAMVVEMAAQIQIAAEAIGGTGHPEDYVAVLRRGHDRHFVRETWAANLRRLARTDPDLFASLQTTSGR